MSSRYTRHPTLVGQELPGPPPAFVTRSPPAERDSIELATLWAALESGWWLMLSSGVLLFTGVMAWTLLGSMAFISSSRLYVGEVDRAGHDDEPLLTQQLSGIATEVEILRSRSLAVRAVRASGANVTIATPGWAPPKYWQWRWSGRDLNILDGSGGRLRASGAKLATSERIPVELRVRVDADGSYDVLREGEVVAHGVLGRHLRLSDVEMTLLPGPQGQPVHPEEFDVTVRPAEDVAEHVLRDLSVSVPDSADGDVVKVLVLSLTRANPHDAARVLSALMAVYLEERQAWKTEDASAAEAFVAKQLEELEGSLDETEGKFAKFRIENRTVISEEEAAAMVEHLAKYEQQRVDAQLEVSMLRDVRKALREPGAPLEAFFFGEDEGDVLASLARTLAEERRKLTDLETRFQSALPQVQEQRANVQAQKARIRNYVDKRLGRATKRLAELEDVIHEYEDKLKALPLAEIRLQQLGRESEVYSRLFSYLLEKKQQTAIVKASNVSKNRVLDSPRVPRHETSPRLMLRMGSGLVGVFLGAFFVLARVLLSTRFQTVNEVRSSFPGLPIVATVPTFVHRRKSGKYRSPPIFDLMAFKGDTSRSAYVEAFRTVRTQLRLQERGPRGRVLLLTSPQAGDGKTICTLSLASALAADDRKVLVIDADIRNPSHHELTGVASVVGFSEVLMGIAHWETAVRRVDLSRNHFHLITTRHESDAEVFSSVWLSCALIEMRGDYDYVLVDVASYPMISDALLVARHADCILSVIRLGNTVRRSAEEHVLGLTSVGRPHMLLVNDAGAQVSYGSPGGARAIAARAGGFPVQPRLPVATVDDDPPGS